MKYDRKTNKIVTRVEFGENEFESHSFQLFFFDYLFKNI